MKRFSIILVLSAMFITQTADSVANVNTDAQKLRHTSILRHQYVDVYRTQYLSGAPNNVIDFLSTDFIVSIMSSSTVRPSIVIAQSIIETGWGKYVKHNNYFGIKSYCTNSFMSVTHEYVDDTYTVSTESFKIFTSLADAVISHSKLLNVKSNVSLSDDPHAAFTKMSRYATDPNYKLKCMHIIRSYNLEQIDSIYMKTQSVH